MRVLVTGSAGFIGFHLTERLLSRGDTVVGIDSISDYYGEELKYGRLKEAGIQEPLQNLEFKVSATNPNYLFGRVDLTDMQTLKQIFAEHKFDVVCHLAAQAGVRYSLVNPQAYIDANIQGFMNVLQCSKDHGVAHFIYASSSSVYGLNQKMPFSIADNVDHPISIYAATKKSNELMAHAYSHLFKLPTTGLRFFTVYGPWGRPDMALFMFTKAILEGTPIKIFNNGEMRRDFTYVDDIVEGIVRVIESPAEGNPEWNAMDPDPSTALSPYRIFNIGRGRSVSLMEFVDEIEKSTGIAAYKEFLPLQPGDLHETWADVTALEQKLSYQPAVSLAEGVSNFVEWYKQFYNHKVPAVLTDKVLF